MRCVHVFSGCVHMYGCLPHEVVLCSVDLYVLLHMRSMQQVLEVVWAAAGAQGTEEGSTPLSSTGTAQCERRLQEAMALAMAVQEFRETCRLDLVSSEQVRLQLRSRCPPWLYVVNSQGS